MANDRETGVNSGLAFFYIVWVVISSYILTIEPYLQLITPKLYQYFIRYQWSERYVGKFLWLSELFYSISSFAAIIILAVLTSSATSAVIAMNIFLIGITFYFATLSFFALYHAEWHSFQIFNLAKYLAFLSFSLFLFFQLFFPGVQTSYRYNGVLWIGLSSIILLYLSSILEKRVTKTEAVMPDLFLIHPCKSVLFVSAKEVISNLSWLSIPGIFANSELNLQEFLIWIVSLLPYLFFCITVTVSVEHGGISFLTFGVEILTESITGYLLLNTYHQSNLEIISWTILSFRFLLVLSGPDYWLFGCTLVLIAMSGFVSLSIFHKLFPLSSKKKLSFDIMMNAIKAKLKNQNINSLESEKSKNLDPKIETDIHIEKLNHLYAISPLSSDILFLVLLQVAFIIVFIVSGTAPHSLSPPVGDWKQSTWGCLMWMGWIVYLVLYITYYGVENGGFRSRSYQHYKVVNFIRSFYGQLRAHAVENMLPEIPLEGILPILCILSWVMFVGWFIFFAVLVHRWVLIPCAAFLPLSIIFYELKIRKWMKEGCIIPTNWKEFTESIRLHLLLQNPSDIENSCDEKSTLFYRIINSWLFPYVLLWTPVLICSGIVYFYPVLYLVLWLMSISISIISILRWRLTLEIDRITALLLLAQWLPLIIWAVVAAQQTDAFNHSVIWIIVVLGLAAISVEMFVLNLFMWRDISNKSIDFTQLPGKENYPIILKYFIIVSFSIMAGAFTILASTLSPAIGICSLFLLVSFFLFVMSYLRIFSLSHYRTHITYLIVFLVLCSGLYGIIFRYEDIFWWISVSWLCLSFVFFLSGLRNDLSSIPKIYGRYYFPVLVQSLRGELLDCSLSSSGILISLVMVCLWALWLRVLKDSAAGGILYVLCLVIIYTYMRHKSLQSNLQSQLIYVNNELLFISLEYALKKIDLLPLGGSNFQNLQDIVRQLISQRDSQFHEIEIQFTKSLALIPFTQLVTLPIISFQIDKNILDLLHNFEKTLTIIEQVDHFYGFFRLHLSKEISAYHSIQRENIVSFLRSCDEETFVELQPDPNDMVSFAGLLPEDLLKLPTDQLTLLLGEFHQYEKRMANLTNTYKTIEERDKNSLARRDSLMRLKEKETKEELLQQEKLLESQVLENQMKLNQAKVDLDNALTLLSGSGDDEDENDGFDMSNSSNPNRQSLKAINIQGIIDQSKTRIESISKENARILKLKSNSKRILENKMENELVGSYGKPLHQTKV